MSAAGGPATLLAVGAGIVVSIGLGWAVDNYGDEIADGFDEGLRSARDGFGRLFDGE